MNEPRNESWWRTLPGILTAITGLIVAVTGLLAALGQIGLVGPRSGSTAAGDADAPSGVPATSPDSSATSEGSSADTGARNASAGDLVRQLQEANVALSANQVEAVRGWVVTPGSPYEMLAETALVVLEGRSLKRTAYLDVIDKWYTERMGGQDHFLTATGAIDREVLKQAMVETINELYGGSAASFEQIVLAPP